MLYMAVTYRVLIIAIFAVMVVFIVDTIFISFDSITRSKFKFRFLFFVVDGFVTFFISSEFALA